MLIALPALFEGTKSSSFAGSASMPPAPKDSRKRASELIWMPNDDSVLKSLVEKYVNNWSLIADAFNSSRVTIRTDKRTAWDCFDRWTTRFSNSRTYDAGTSAADEGRPQTPSTPSHMTTRGHKRSISSTAGGSAFNAAAANNKQEPKKRLRHTLMHEVVRKSMKKKEAALKSSCEWNSHDIENSRYIKLTIYTAVNQRKPAVIHDTHGQYNNMKRYTPQELNRIKYETFEKEKEEALQRQKSHELLNRQQYLIREQAQRAAVAGGASNMVCHVFLLYAYDAEFS